MFIGHHAAALAAKRAAPRGSLGLYVAAAMLLDLIWPVLVLAGAESFQISHEKNPFLHLHFTSYPWSHSLTNAAAWSIVFGLLVLVVLKSRRVAVVAGLAVFSHWVLDWLTHVPDLPLWPGGPNAGLGLWRCPSATIVVELLLFAGGIALYRTMKRPKPLAFWSYVVFLLVTYIASIVGPPPPNVYAVAWSALLALVFIPWTWWADR